MDLKRWGLVLTLGCFMGAQALPEDPVMKARSQRAQAQGIDEADLPPVPRAIMEPPPLPPPETHVKDSPHARTVRSVRHGAKGAKRAKGNSAQDARPVRQPHAAKPVGKTARKSGKRVKP